MERVSMPAQPNPGSIYPVGTLREVLAAMKAEHPALVSRLDCAASLLVTLDLRPAPLGGSGRSRV
jgi:hypothetical protein